MTEEAVSLVKAAQDAETSGDFALAESLFLKARAHEPTERKLQLLHAVCVAKQGRAFHAIGLLHEYLTVDPKSTLALNWMSVVLREGGDPQSALIFSERAARLDESQVETVYNLALCYYALNHFEQAIFCLDRAISLSPDQLPSLYALACVYEAIGQPWQALMAIKKHVAIAPHPEGLLKLAQLSLTVDRLDDAIEHAHRALEKPSTRAAAHLVLADAYADRDGAQSQEHLRLALTIDPGLRETYENGRAKRLSRLGRMDEAATINRQLSEEAPQSGVGYLNLVTVKKIGEADKPLVEKMLAVVGDSELPQIERASAHFALGKALDDLGDYEAAMGHYREANMLTRQLHPSLANFDRKQFARRIDALIGLFSRDFIAKHANRANESRRPIFIVGMMRSGTTLAEQVLASHSKVAAGGELAHWTYSERGLVDFVKRQVGYTGLRTATARYLEILSTIDSEADHVTDKNPANLFAVGLVALAFPSAQVVSMNRDPLETALSIFMTPVRHPPEFGCDLENIAFAIRQTRRLMRHWQSVLRPGQIHEIQYEDLVRSQEATTRELLSSCGLRWEEACLHPEQSRTIVGTPSMWQVRQPVNRSSAGRSERYAPFLEAVDKLF